MVPAGATLPLGVGYKLLLALGRVMLLSCCLFLFQPLSQPLLPQFDEILMGFHEELQVP